MTFTTDHLKMARALAINSFTTQGIKTGSQPVFEGSDCWFITLYVNGYPTREDIVDYQDDFLESLDVRQVTFTISYYESADTNDVTTLNVSADDIERLYNDGRSLGCVEDKELTLEQFEKM